MAAVSAQMAAGQFRDVTRAEKAVSSPKGDRLCTDIRFECTTAWRITKGHGSPELVLRQRVGLSQPKHGTETVCGPLTAQRWHRDSTWALHSSDGTEATWGWDRN